MVRQIVWHVLNKYFLANDFKLLEKCAAEFFKQVYARDKQGFLEKFFEESS